MKSHPPFDRRRLLMIATVQIELLVEELARLRVSSSRSDTLRLAYTKALTPALSVYAGILKDGDIEQMKKELELLKVAIHAKRRP